MDNRSKYIFIVIFSLLISSVLNGSESPQTLKTIACAGDWVNTYIDTPPFYITDATANNYLYDRFRVPNEVELNKKIEERKRKKQKKKRYKNQADADKAAKELDKTLAQTAAKVKEKYDKRMEELYMSGSAHAQSLIKEGTVVSISGKGLTGRELTPAEQDLIHSWIKSGKERWIRVTTNQSAKKENYPSSSEIKHQNLADAKLNWTKHGDEGFVWAKNLKPLIKTKTTGRGKNKKTTTISDKAFILKATVPFIRFDKQKGLIHFTPNIGQAFKPVSSGEKYKVRECVQTSVDENGETVKKILKRQYFYAIFEQELGENPETFAPETFVFDQLLKEDNGAEWLMNSGACFNAFDIKVIERKDLLKMYLYIDILRDISLDAQRGIFIPRLDEDFEEHLIMAKKLTPEMRDQLSIYISKVTSTLQQATGSKHFVDLTRNISHHFELAKNFDEESQKNFENYLPYLIGNVKLFTKKTPNIRREKLDASQLVNAANKLEKSFLARTINENLNQVFLRFGGNPSAGTLKEYSKLVERISSYPSGKIKALLPYIKSRLVMSDPTKKDYDFLKTYNEILDSIENLNRNQMESLTDHLLNRQLLERTGLTIVAPNFL